MSDLNELLAKDVPDGAASEAQYQALWHAHVKGVEDPFDAAVIGGLMADRFAWVFSGGYQGAMRAVFPDLTLEGWGAFAVSEDRSGELPWVNWEARGDDCLINGYKTWIAASEVVDDIIFKAGRGGAARFFVVSRDTPGLTISNKDKPGFLPNLSQGIAHFDDVLLGPDAQVDTRRVPMFGTLEVLFIYIAFLASSHRRYPALQSPAAAALVQARDIVAHWVPRDDPQFTALNREVQRLLGEIGTQFEADNADWQRDRKLIEIYDRE